MWWFSLSVHAATLTVGPGQAWPTIAGAVGAAVDGDTIEIHPGTYTESVTTPKDLDFVGIGAPTWRAAAGPALLSRGHASVTGLRFDGVQNTLACVRVEGPDRTFSVTDSRFASCTYGVRGEDNIVLDIVGSRFVGNTVGVQAYSAPRLSVETSLFYRNTDALLATAVKLQFYGNVVVDNQGGLDVEANEGSVLRGNQFCRNRSTGGAHLVVDWGDYGQPNPIQIDQNLFVDNSASAGRGGAVTVESYYSGEYWVNLTNNTFVGNHGSTASGFYFNAVHATLESNLFAHGTGAGEAFTADASWYYGGGLDVDGDWNLFFDNAGGHLDGVRRADLGRNTLWDVDPMLTSWLDDADCTNDDFAPLPGSPLIDAGDPSVTDPDGSRSDIGTVLYP